MEPITRAELFMAAAAGQTVNLPDPITREETFLFKIYQFVSSGGASPEAIQSAVNQYLEENPVGIDLAMTGAKVGDIAKISAVDENGVPTAWEPVGYDSTQNAYVLPVGGDELGGVKNGGNVTINADGTMTAPEATTENTGDGIFTNKAALLLVNILKTAKFEADVAEAIEALQGELGLNIASGLVWMCSTVEATGSLNTAHGTDANGVPSRLCALSYYGDFVAVTITDALESKLLEYYRGDLYMPTIPAGSTFLTVPEHGISGIQIAPSIYAADGTRLYDPGYGTKQIDLTAYPDAVYYSANVKGIPTAEAWVTISETITAFEFS